MFFQKLWLGVRLQDHHVPENCGWCKASRPPHASKQWLGVRLQDHHVPENCGWCKASRPPHASNQWLGVRLQDYHMPQNSVWGYGFKITTCLRLCLVYGFKNTMCLKTMVGGKASRPPHASKQWLGVRLQDHCA